MKKVVAILIAVAITFTLVAVVAANGRPTFNDVPLEAYYAEAVQWAVDNGITTGTSVETFSPDEPCTRGQVVTMLWRYHMKFGQGQTHEPTEPTPSETETPTEPTAPVEPTEPTEPTETEAPTEPTEPIEPEPYTQTAFEWVYDDDCWSGDEIVIEPVGGGRVRVDFPGIGAQLQSGDTVLISFDGSASIYMRGLYTWRLDMSLEQPITELLNRECVIASASTDYIVIDGNLNVERAYVCMLAERNKPAWIKIEK